MRELWAVIKRIFEHRVEYYFGGDNIPFSVEAKFLKANIKDFDEKDCREWFLRELSIGSRNVMEYLKYREIQKMKAKEKKEN